MARYGLATHVFVCRDEEYIVVLDLRKDRYFALEAARTAGVGPLLAGWPASAADSSVDNGAAALAPLLRQGWLSESSANSKDATPVRVAVPVTDLAGGESRAKLSVSMLFAFVMASLFAKFALRFWGLERVVERVARRKARAAEPVDIERARELVEAFARLRVFLFSTRDECLRDSLSVLEFLARYGMYPDWVFGVRARPFAAHCWVQYQDMVFNDTVEHVITYVPIMAV